MKEKNEESYFLGKYTLIVTPTKCSLLKNGNHVVSINGTDLTIDTFFEFLFCNQLLVRTGKQLKDY